MKMTYNYDREIIVIIPSISIVNQTNNFWIGLTFGFWQIGLEWGGL